jgi:hypothetical protein
MATQEASALSQTLPPTLDLVAAEWTLKEDAFLVEVSTRYPAILKQPQRLHSMYMARHRRDKINFPKTSLNSSAVSARIESLASPENAVFLKLARHIVSSQESRQAAQVPSQPPSEPVNPPPRGRMPAKFDSKPTGASNVVITFRSNDGSVRTVTTAKAPLIEQSDLFRRLGETWAPRGGRSDPQRVSLNESLHPDCSHDFAHFSEENFDRFLLFCRHPDCASAQVAFSNAIRDLREGRAADLEEVSRSLASRRKDRLQRIAATREIKHSVLAREMDAALEEEIRLIRSRHEASRLEAAALVDARFDELERDAEAFYDQQLAACTDAIADMTGERESALSAEAAENSAVVNQLLPVGPRLPELLALAEAVQCDSMRSACVDLIAKNFSVNGVAGHPALTSCGVVRPSSQRAILASLSVKEVQRAATSARPHISRSLVSAELAWRRSAAAEELQALGLTELTLLKSTGGHPFPDLVDQILASRQSASSGVSLTSVPSGVLLTGGTTVIAQAKRRYLLVCASHPATQRQNTRSYFEVSVVDLHTDIDGEIAIGLAPAPTPHRPASGAPRRPWEMGDFVSSPSTSARRPGGGDSAQNSCAELPPIFWQCDGCMFPPFLLPSRHVDFC